MRYLLIISGILLCLNVKAQHFTDIVQQTTSGKGVVTIKQDSVLSALVNAKTVSSLHTKTDTTSTITVTNIPIHHTGKATKIQGFRIQIYAGGNSRKNKQEAELIASRARALVNGHSVYTNFISPRWVCRVGDFRSHSEAFEALSILKSSGFPNAIIVKSPILIYLD